MARSAWQSANADAKNKYMQDALNQVAASSKSLDEIMSKAFEKMNAQNLFSGTDDARYETFVSRNPAFRTMATNTFVSTNRTVYVNRTPSSGNTQTDTTNDSPNDKAKVIFVVLSILIIALVVFLVTKK